MNTSPAPVESVCLLRLSALGDVTHVLPLIRTLRRAWPQVEITWVIGKGEHRLLDGLPGVHFVEYDKKSGLRGMWALRKALKARLGKRKRFDALLQMQVAARANLLSAFIPARLRVGYDKSRSKDLHGLFINTRIPAPASMCWTPSAASASPSGSGRKTSPGTCRCRRTPSPGPARNGRTMAARC